VEGLGHWAGCHVGLAAVDGKGPVFGLPDVVVSAQGSLLGHQLQLGLLGLGALLGLTAIAIEFNSNASDGAKAVKADGGCGSACCALPSNKPLLATP
jgi:hypothetical protein